MIVERKSRAASTSEAKTEREEVSTMITIFRARRTAFEAKLMAMATATMGESPSRPYSSALCGLPSRSGVSSVVGTLYSVFGVRFTLTVDPLATPSRAVMIGLVGSSLMVIGISTCARWYSWIRL